MTLKHPSLHYRRSLRSTTPYCVTWWAGQRNTNSSWKTRTSSWLSYRNPQEGASKLLFCSLQAALQWWGTGRIGDSCQRLLQYRNNDLSSLVPGGVTLINSILTLPKHMLSLKPDMFFHKQIHLTDCKKKKNMTKFENAVSKDTLICYIIFFYFIIN